LTGFDLFAEELDAKRLELLKETLPRATRVAVLWNPENLESSLQRRRLQVAAQTLGVRLQFVEARRPSEVDTAFAAMARERPDELLVAADPMFTTRAGRIIETAARTKLPTIYYFRDYVEAGGLMSYGADFPAVYRRAALYVDRILTGAKPVDLPVEQPTKFELVVNMKTAKALSLTIPPALLLRAEQIIDR
jgi:putative ABC transport system substrate-binding protein